MNALTITTVAVILFLLFLAVLRRVLIRSRTRRNLEKLLKSSTRQAPHAFASRTLEDLAHGMLIGDTECLRIGSDRGVWELPWDDVEEVQAFKRDLLTTDLICLSFKKTGADLFFEINEEMAGYHDLMELLPSRLPGFRGDWFGEVAFPAFAPNHQVIWKRESAKEGASDRAAHDA